MSAQHYAKKIAAILNEAEEEGFEVRWTSRNGSEGLEVGEGPFVVEPPCEGEPWEAWL